MCVYPSHGKACLMYVYLSKKTSRYVLTRHIPRTEGMFLPTLERRYMQCGPKFWWGFKSWNLGFALILHPSAWEPVSGSVIKLVFPKYCVIWPKLLNWLLTHARCSYFAHKRNPCSLSHCWTSRLRHRQLGISQARTPAVLLALRYA